jgi:transitional endoplasmic reticulum ATPase
MRLSESTEYYSGADIQALVREAAMNAIRRDPNAEYVTLDDFMLALRKVRPSLDEAIIDWYENYYRKMETKRINLPPAFA